MLSSAGLGVASSVDTAVVDATAPTGDVGLETGQSASIQINMTVTGAQGGNATFQIYRDWSLSGGTFTGSAPQTFNIPGPRTGSSPALTLSTTGTISVASGQALGNFTLAIGAFDITNSNTTGAKLAAGGSSNYVVHVVPPSDATPPVIMPNVSGTLGNNGWYTSDVSVSWSVTDAQSGVTSSSGCGSTTIITDTAETTLTCTAISAGGAASNSVTIKRDATAPMFAANPSAAANAAGFNNSPVDVSYSCSDETSGLADSCPATDHATTDGTHTYSHTIHDNAGNASAVSTTVNLDATKPAISGAALPAANGTGWNNSDVNVTFACVDSGTGASGIKSCVADGTSPASDHKTLSSDGANQSVSGTATDNADNTNTATVSGINIDKTPPLITFAGRTEANARGWNDSDVTVTWNCSDPGGSGVVGSTVSQTLTGNGAGQSATGTCEDKAGNQASDTVTAINIDKTAPVITFDNRAPDANGAGWNNSDVTVTWNCSDSVSDVVNAAVSQAVSTEGANQSATGTCADLSGNTASDTHGGINIDRTAPSVAFASASPEANGAGWRSTDVTVTFTATDSLSGFAGGSPTSTGTATTSGEGSALTVNSPAFTDLAGNTAAAGTATGGPFSVDNTAPGIAFDHQSPAANGNGWNNSDVTLYWNCSDGLSGPASTPVTQVISSEGSNLTATGTCSDNADNTKSDTQGGVNIDKTAPLVSVTGVSDGATYTLGSVPAATCTTTDTLSGVQTDATISLSGGPVGAMTAACSGGKDNADNLRSPVSVTYNVNYNWTGFLRPVDNPGTGTTPVFNNAKAGQSIPAKFSLHGNQGLNIIAANYPKVTTVACSSAAPMDAIEEYATTTNQGLVYDATADLYNYVWKTQSSYANSCRMFDLQLNDGTHHVAYFRFTK